MTSQSTGDASIISCPLCSASIDRDHHVRCPRCGMDVNDPALAQVLEANAAIDQCEEQYELARTRWQQWYDHRTQLLTHLQATRRAPTVPSERVRPHPDDQAASPAAPEQTPAEPAAADAVSSATTVASSAGQAETADAGASPRTTVTEPAPSVDHASEPAAQPQPPVQPEPATARAGAATPPRARPQAQRHAPRLLTAPVLLGVSGASLLIAAAVVFVAVTWNTFFPLAQGLLVLAISAGVAYLAWWLGRLHLVITSGAVGVVAMAFAGVSVIAFDREALVLGNFATPVALAVTSLAGLALARVGLRWVNATSALAVVGTAIGLTIASLVDLEIPTVLVWTLIGTATAAVVASGLRWWKGAPARVILRFGAVAWATVSGLIAAGELYRFDAPAVQVFSLVVPVLALAAAVWWMPRIAAGPAALVASAAALAGASHLTDSVWIHVAAAVVVAGIALAVGRWTSPRAHAALFVGAMPSLVASALAGVVAGVWWLVAILRLLVEGTDAAIMANLSPWVGLPAVAGAGAVLALRLWPADSRIAGYRTLSVALWVPGVAASSFMAVAHSAATVPTVVLASVAGAAVLMASARVWEPGFARTVSRVAGLVLVLIAAVVGARSLWTAEAEVWSVVSAVAALVAVGACARWWLRVCVAATAALAPLVAAGVADVAGAPSWMPLAAAAGALVLVSLAARFIPARARGWLGWGSSPTLVVMAVATLVAIWPTVGSLLTRMVGDGYIEGTEAIPPLNTGVGLAVSFTGVALAVVRWWRPQPSWLAPASLLGSAALVVGLTSVSTSVVEPWVQDDPRMLTLSLALTSVLLAGAGWAFLPRAAVWTMRGAGIVLMTAAGVHAAVVHSTGDFGWWLGLAIAAAPVVALALAVKWWLPQTLPSTAFLATAVTASSVIHVHDSLQIGGAAAVALAAALLWAALRLPSRWGMPLLGGLVPALAWGVAVAVGTAAGLVSRIALGDEVAPELALDPWTTATTMLVGVSLAALARWEVSARAAAANSMLGAVVVLVGGGALTAVVADAWSLPSVTAYALSALVAAGSAAAFIILWTTSNARWVNGVGATILITIAGVNGAVVFADAAEAAWVGVALSLGPVAILLACGRWWPRLTLAPAAFLVTATAAGLAERLALQVEATVTFALIAAAALAWGATLLSDLRRWPLLAGIVPAVIAGAIAMAAVIPVSLMTVTGVAMTVERVDGALWNAAMMAALAVGMGASRWWRTGKAIVDLAGVLGAVATAAAAMAVTSAVTEATDGWWALDTYTGLASSMVVAATIWLWPTSVARWVAGIAATAWVTTVSLVAVADLTWEQVQWWAGLGAITLATAMLVVAARWRPRVTLGPAAVIASMGATGAVAGAGGDWDQIHFTVAVALAVVLWVAHTQPAMRAVPLRWGAIPAAVITTVVLLMLVVDAVERYVGTIDGSDIDPLGPWAGATAVTAFAATMAWRPARQVAGWVAVPFLVLASASLPVVVAALALAVLGGVAAYRPWLTRSTPESALALPVVGLGWAAQSDGALAAVAGVIAAIALWTAVSDERRRQTWTLVVSPLAAALAMVWLIGALGGSDDLAVTMAAGAALSMPVLARVWGVEPRMVRAVVLVSVATVLMPVLASTLTTAGIITLMAGAAWLALAVLGVRAARWVSIGVLSFGAMLLLIDANVQVIEAYTAVPAVSVLGVGLWWMYGNPQVHSMRALGPGLTLALVPSFLALVLQPGSLMRTLILTAATVAMALAGVLLKWFAPILATAVTAVVVAVAQIVVGDNIAVRVASFAVVGVLLLVIATTYEKLKELR